MTCVVIVTAAAAALAVGVRCGVTTAAAAGPLTRGRAPAVRIGFESWPDAGVTEVSGAGQPLRIAVTEPIPRTAGARRRFNVRSTGSFPLWGWKPERYQDLWSP